MPSWQTDSFPSVTVHLPGRHALKRRKLGGTLMDPRIVLENIVKRLDDPQRALGKVSPGHFSAWEGQEAALHNRLAGGRGPLAQARLMAGHALATQDPDLINAAALICPGLERDGMKTRTAAPRNAGGKKRGEAVRSAAATTWAPYVTRHCELGCTEKARRSVVTQMERDKFKLPNTGKFPGRRSIQKWLPIRKAEGS